MVKKTGINRREFLKDTALAGAGAATLGGLDPASVLGANDRIRVGVIGTEIGRASCRERVYHPV